MDIFHQFLSTLFPTKLIHLFCVGLLGYNLLHLCVNLDIIKLHLYLDLTRSLRKVTSLVHPRSDQTRSSLNNAGPKKPLNLL